MLTTLGYAPLKSMLSTFTHQNKIRVFGVQKSINIIHKIVETQIRLENYIWKFKMLICSWSLK